MSTDSSFPGPFLWGAATSAHQVEGENRGNDWWEWEQTGKVPFASGKACDHYERFREDFQIASRLGHNAHRFSIEWSRLEPRENQWDSLAFRHYENVIQELRSKGIEPVVTLHHFTNPRWFTEKGGWIQPEAAHYFSRFVQRVIQAYGSDVRFWITLNEPMIYIYFGYVKGIWPPGRQSIPEAMRVLKHLLYAHVGAYDVIHRYYRTVLKSPVWVSIAKHMMELTPCCLGSWGDRMAVFVRDWLLNRLVIDALQTGFLFCPGFYCEFLPAHSTMDYIGLNYYTRHFIRFNGWTQDGIWGAECDPKHHREKVLRVNTMGREVYPEGFYRILKRLSFYRLPVMIYENGICCEDDQERIDFIRDHFAQLEKAMREGIPIEGYFYWSLLDNYEWDSGFDPRFGIVEVCYRDFMRKIRPSAQELSRFCRQLVNQGALENAKRSVRYTDSIVSQSSSS